MFAIPFMELSSPPARADLALDAGSFGRFYDDALPRVYGYFLHRCGGSVATAEDLTQETFLAAVAELKKERKVARPTSWICGIARHKLLDHYRSQGRVARPVAEVTEVEDETLAFEEDGAREHAVAALAAVAASQRAALVLCYMDGYSTPEAAELLGKSVEGVESLLSRGRLTFKRAYRKELQ